MQSRFQSLCIAIGVSDDDQAAYRDSSLMSLPMLSDEEVADFALSLSQIERAVIRLCSKDRAWQYISIAEKICASYCDVQIAAQKLQRARLAHVSVIPYDGSRMFLNHRGEQVKHAVEILSQIENARRRPTGIQLE